MNNVNNISNSASGSDVGASAELDAKFESGERQVINEIDRLKLPEFVELSNKLGFINLPPLSQRRILWNTVQQSRLIESFIINIPVPPLVFYEQGYKSYEVIDGRERISTIQAFYQNQLRLKGLELYPELNGYTYGELPWKIQATLDRRSISFVAMIGSAELTTEEAQKIKQIAFEQFNLSRSTSP